MIIQGKGILRHMFHGEYSCAVGIEFANEAECDAACVPLNVGRPFKDIGDWKKSIKHPHMVLGSLTSEQLEAFKNLFHPQALPCNSFGCKNKIHEIDGVDHSIDVGPPFTIDLDVPNKDQLKLF